MCGGSTGEPSIVAPMPGILGDQSSGSEGEDVGGGGASPPKDAEVGSTDRRHVVSALEVSKDEVEERSQPIGFQSVTF